MMKRCLCILIACLLLFSTVAASALEIGVHFPMTFIDRETNVINLPLDDAWFLEPSDVYNHALAQLSIGMAVSSFRSNAEKLSEKDNLLRSFMAQGGFTDYVSEEFDIEPTASTIASGIAQKTLRDGSVLLAVGVSGQGYEKEWMSNFAVGAGESHTGFTLSAEKVVGRIHNYMEQYQLDPAHTKVWLAGFSRAAAVSNMTAAMLIQEDMLADENIFCYAFATPANTADPIAYPQIQNICGSMDIVPQVPLANWGYGRYGITHYLPSMETDSHYPEKAVAAKETSVSVVGFPEEQFASSAQVNWLLSKVIELLYDLFPQASDYAKSFQEVLISTYGLTGGMADKVQYMFSAIQANPELLSSVSKEGDNAMTLLTSIAYTLLSEMTGEHRPAWVNDIESASNLFHEHLPEIYLTWMLSTDDPAVLFDHPEDYTRIIYSGTMQYTVMDSKGNDVTNRMSAFIISNQHLLTIPADDRYIVTLTAHNCDAQFAVRRHNVRMISQDLLATEGMHLFDNEIIEIIIPKAGKPTLLLDGSRMPLTDQYGLQSICTEIVLRGNQSRKDLDEFLVYLAADVFPHLISYVFILLNILLLIVRRKKLVNTPYEAVKPWRTVLTLLGIVFIINSMVYHGVLFLGHTIINSGIDVNTSFAMRVGKVLGVSMQVYELGNIASYLLLAVLCFRGRRLSLSNWHGQRLCWMLLILNLVQFAGQFIMVSPPPVTGYIIPIADLLAIVAFARAKGKQQSAKNTQEV